MKTAGLKAMFWKECRENSNWAILGALCLALSLAYLLYNDSPSVNTQSVTLATVWGIATLALTLGAPFIGLALGLLQILPELRRDRWAFLIHRPASRTALFFGKVLPGLCLYGLATILPLCGLLVWYLRYSGLTGPFDLRFLLGAWAAILSGLAFYFAGLLIALRPARWYGSRALPAFFALLASYAVTILPEFWMAAGGSLLIAAVLALAAWGSFATMGQYIGQTKPARFSLGLVLLIGSTAITLIVLMTLINIIHNAFPQMPGFGSSAYISLQYQIDAEGRLWMIRDYVDEAHVIHETVTDSSGKVVPSRLAIMQAGEHMPLTLAPLDMSRPAGSFARYSDPNRYVQLLGTEMIDPQQQLAWYYESDARQIVGYAVQGQWLPPVAPAALYGYLGPHGFSRNAAEAGRFEAGTAPESGAQGYGALLRSRHALYVYDTSARVVKLLQASRSAAGIEGVTSAALPGLIVRADGLFTVYVGRQARFTIPVSFAPGGSSEVQVAAPPNGSRFYFLYGPGAGSSDLHLVTLDAGGRVLRTETLPKPQLPTPIPTRLFLIRAYLIDALIPPALVVPIGTNWGTEASQFGIPALLSAFAGLLSALLAWRISRRCGDTRRGQLAWAFGVFWLGPYGVLMLLALREWPARVPCPVCGRPRVVSRERCEHCGSPFDRPKRDGTEIFDGEARETEGRETEGRGDPAPTRSA